MIPPLFKHQKQTADFIEPKPETFCTSTPGTGKTRSMLEVHHRTPNKSFIVAPKTIMDVVWVEDMRTFYPDHNCEAFNRKYQKDPHYLKNLLDRNDAVVINHDAATDLLKWCKGTHLLDLYDRFILDEFTAIKNRTAIRSKSMAELSKQFEFKTLLSGSPTPRSLLDIWHPAFILDGGLRLGYNYFDFRNAICQPVQKGNYKTYVEWEVLPGAIDEVGHLLRDITIRHELENVVDMPKRIYRTLTLKMPATLRKQYEKMKKTAILELQQGDITAVNAAVLGNKLLQIASGSIYGNDGTMRKLHNDKYEVAVQLVKERDHSLIFYQWRHQYEALKQLLLKEKIDFEVINGDVSQDKRGQIVQDFQAGKYQTLLIQPAAAAHGLTLTRSTTSIWVSPTFNLEHFIQANYRDYRIGQKKRSEVIMLKYADTIESKVYNNLQGKTDSQKRLLEILKT
jgi:SNF2 family DNA or RNA helicase